ncbi:hypothetical protein MMC25_003827 [Agyrium rufum]|nr:hypothetical protein [Agyrium rufum]
MQYSKSSIFIEEPATKSCNNISETRISTYSAHVLMTKTSQVTKEKVEQPKPQTTKSPFFHLKTLWLLTVRDIPVLILPQTAFGIFSALSGELLTSNGNPEFGQVLSRIPLVILWNWLNVLLFCLANQRLPGSILEDSLNKPWRPLPARRLSPDDARRLLLFLIPVVYTSTLYLGGRNESTALMIMTWMYNDLGGADESYITRNVLNAAGIVCYSAGSTIVATGYLQHTLAPAATVWLAIVWGIIVTTLQVMDLADMEGDAARERKTIPLVLGEQTTRWSIVLFVMIWSVICPTFWELQIMGYAVSLAMGAFLSFRVLLYRGVREDKSNFWFWSLWTVTLYLLPFGKRITSEFCS